MIFLSAVSLGWNSAQCTSPKTNNGSRAAAPMAARPLLWSKPFAEHRSSWPATARMTPLPRRFHRPAPVAPLPRERHRHRSLKMPSSKEVIKESAHARSPHNLPEVLFPAVLVRRCIPKRTAGENLCDDDKKPVCSRLHGKKNAAVGYRRLSLHPTE